jgi:hypothetical protein
MRALLVAAALLFATSAHAVYQCGPQKDDCKCGADNPYPCCDNGGNCTWWAWEDACCNWAVGLPSWGNANQWAGNARANGNYHVETWPVTSAVSCRASGQYGHVAFVISLNGGTSITVEEQNCWGNYGMRQWTYSDYHFFDGGYITRAGQVECQPGDSSTQGCGQCGSQSRGCGNDGKWGGFGACGGEGACAPKATGEQPCGKCGKQTRTCGGDCTWGAWGACSGEADCTAGDKQSQPCGNCGTQEKVCSPTCAWGDWGDCSGEGVCAPGATEDLPCGDCGTHKHTCGTACAWGEFETCVAHNPTTPTPCDTGLLGVCAAGELKCVGGTATCVQLDQASPEVCNGLDDDCNGLTDDGLDCPDAGAVVPVVHGDAGAKPPVVVSPTARVGAGCGCMSTPDGAFMLMPLLIVLALRRRPQGVQTRVS